MEPIPNAMIAAANAKSRKLRGLVRAPEILVMPGAYDVLSALLFEQMGFKAIQGTSGGIAVALGYPDGEVMSREMFIEVSGSFAAAVTVPFNADGERGYGDEAGVRDTVRALVARGVAGMNLEDGAAKGKGGLVEIPEQLKRSKQSWKPSATLAANFFSMRVSMLSTSSPTIRRKRWMKRFNAVTPMRRPEATVFFICSSIRLRLSGA